jgi:hypothetical protein
MRARLVMGVAAAAVAVAAAADAQTTRIAMEARPTKLQATQNVLLIGRIASRAGGETVTLQGKLCGQSSYRNLTAFKTAPGGVFRVEWSVGMNATLRARWRGATSRPVLVRQSPIVQLDQTSANEFEVGVGSLGLMWRKRVDIQRRVGGRWELVRRVTLTDTAAGPGSSGVWTEGHFRLSVPPGTPLRAVLTAAEARPCYLAATSRVLRAQG